MEPEKLSDELREWFEQGFRALVIYLEKQLAFAVYWEEWSKSSED